MLIIASRFCVQKPVPTVITKNYLKNNYNNDANIIFKNNTIVILISAIATTKLIFKVLKQCAKVLSLIVISNTNK